MSLTFVVSTGRCGSTLLSLILREHRDVLSLSEFFSTVMRVSRAGGFPTADMDGAELWRLLATPDPLAGQLARQAQASPVAASSGPGYPFGTGRFTPDDLPPICQTVLPTLTDAPDALFDQLAAEVPRWPRRPAAGQYRALFALLSRLLGRPVIVERTGGLFPVLPLVHREFPEARFVHLYRDGPDCALSMSQHPGFRVAAVNAEAARVAGLPPDATWKQIQANLPDQFKGLLTPPYDLHRLMTYPIPLTTFAHRWSDMICHGLTALRQLPPGSWTSLRYEDLLHHPTTELTRLAAFTGIPALPGWLATATRLVDPARAGRAATTPPPTQLASLRHACQPGTDALTTTTTRVAASPGPANE
jgi:hypothetical protein